LIIDWVKLRIKVIIIIILKLNSGINQGRDTKNDIIIILKLNSEVDPK